MDELYDLLISLQAILKVDCNVFKSLEYISSI